MNEPLFSLEFYQKNITKEAKDWVELQFPVEHYGDILIFEAWPLRVLFEMTYVAGANEKTKELQAELKEQCLINQAALNQMSEMAQWLKIEHDYECADRDDTFTENESCECGASAGIQALASYEKFKGAL